MSPRMDYTISISFFVVIMAAAIAVGLTHKTGTLLEPCLPDGTCNGTNLICVDNPKMTVPNEPRYICDLKKKAYP